MESQHDELILWVKPLGKVTNTAWLINKPIIKTTEIDGYFSTYPKRISELRSFIKVESTSRLPARVTVPPGSVLFGDVAVYPNMETALRATITVGSHEFLHARIEMDLANQMEGDVEVFGGGHSEMASRIVVAQHEYLNSRIKIKPSNRMYGLLELFPIPRTNFVKYPNKDSFIRDDLQRINYGSLPTMEIGINKTPYSDKATFNSVIGFDFTDLPSGAIVEKAELVLTAAQYKEVMKYTVEFLDSAWQEQTIAWVNAPTTSEPKEVTDTGTGSQVRLDILPFVKRWVEREDKLPNNGIQISLKDVKDAWTLFTKEYDIVGDRPRLEMTYYDRDLSFSADYRQIPAKIRVARDVTSTLRGRIKIVSIQGSDELKGRIVVENERDLASRIRVTRTDLESHIQVRRVEEDKLHSRIAVLGAGDSELKSHIKVTRENLDSTIIVAETDNLPATIQVMGHEYLNARAVLSREFMLGTITVAESDDLPAKIVVQRAGESKLPARIRNAHMSKLNATMKVAVTDTLPASIIVQQEMTRRIPAIIHVERNSHSDLKAYMKVEYDSLLNATIKVNSDYLPSRIALASEDDTDLKATIVVDDSHMQSRLKGKITVEHSSDLLATIKVTSDYLPSTVSIAGDEVNNLNAQIKVAQFLISEMVSFIEVGNPRDMKARIVVEASDAMDTGYVFIM